MIEEISKMEVMQKIEARIDNPTFLYFLDELLKKWEVEEKELEKIDNIMESICKEWGVTRKELMENRKNYEPRAVLFYMLKKHLKYSYETISKMFDKSKGNIWKLIDDLTFRINTMQDGKQAQRIKSIEENIIFA